MSFRLPTFGPLPKLQQAIQEGSDTIVPSSFGIDDTTFNNFSAHSFIASERYQLLEYRERYYKCTQHDSKSFDFNGNIRQPGAPTSQPMISASQSPHYVTLNQRRPSAPYHIAKLIVNSFTSLLFGYGHFPTFSDDDPTTQDFAEALAQETKLESVMIRGRNIGGSVGTVGFSWQFIDGKPKILTHNGKHLFVHEWHDRIDCIPEHVSEIYQFPKDVFDTGKQKIIRKLFWYRRDWNTVADVVFKEVEVGRKEPEWEIDEEKSFVHNDGFCHFVWCQNLPEDDSTSIDGQVDYAELYDCCDSIDVLNSITVRGGINNLDPTLKLKMDPQLINRFGIKKGSENAIIVGMQGDASYMEMSGTSIDAGIKLFVNQRASILEVAQCVCPDPNTITAAGTSSAALKIVFGPMLSKCCILRTQYGKAIEQILNQMIQSAQKLYNAEDNDFDLIPDEEGNLQEVATPVQYFVKLPPRIVEEIEINPITGESTGKIITSKVERHPGTGGSIQINWSEYFASTTNDDQVKVQTLSVATGGKQILSRKSATRVAATVYRIDPDKEIEALLSEDKEQRERESSMFEGIGGSVQEPIDQSQPDSGAAQVLDKTVISTNIRQDNRSHNIQRTLQTISGNPESDDSVSSGDSKTKGLKLGDKEIAAILTVNEGRRLHGLDILRDTNGDPDLDGDLSIAQYKTKMDAKAQITGDAVGKEETGQPLITPEPPMPKSESII